MDSVNPDLIEFIILYRNLRYSKMFLIFIIIPRRVLLERNQLKTSLATTQSIISKLNLSFDPLSRSDPVTRTEDILQQAESLNRSCQALCDRLVGKGIILIGSA